MIDLLSMLNSRCSIRRTVEPVPVSASGTPMPALHTAQQSTPCAIAPMRGGEHSLYARYVSRAGSTWLGLPSATVTAKDVIVCNGRTYEVQFVEQRMDDDGDPYCWFAVLEETI